MIFRLKTISFCAMFLIMVMMQANCSNNDNLDDNNTGMTFQQNESLPAENAIIVLHLIRLHSTISEITGGTDWLTVTKQASTLTSPAIRISATDNVKINSKTESRNALITIVCENGDRLLLMVTQEGSEGKSGTDYINKEETDVPAYAREIKEC